MERPPRQRNPAKVGLDDADQRLRAEPAPQLAGQPGIQLDRDDPRPGPGERAGQGTVSGAEIDNEVSGARAARPDQLGDQPEVSQEVRTCRIRRRRPTRRR
jgi:hypothetical protein